MASKNDDDLMARALVESVNEPDEPPPAKKPRRTRSDGWYPDLNPTQRLAFEDPAEIVIMVGPKGSGKSYGAGDKVIRHLYENYNALTIAIAPTQTTGYEGFGYDLENQVIPRWVSGIGLDAMPWRMDSVTKDRHMWVGNRQTGWSKLMLKSIPHASMVQSRIKGPAPSQIYVEELTNCSSRDYFTFPHAQLGRRQGITGPQQYLATCNPEDPDHWVYTLCYEDEAYVLDEGDPRGRVWPNDPERPGIVRDPALSVYFVPFGENAHRLPAGYRAKLERSFRSDPILYKRLIDGRWMAYPKGDAIFKLFFSEAQHVVGDAKMGRGLVPHPGYPIVMGYDLGKVNSGIVFMQCMETKFGPYWIIFDEIYYTGKHLPYRKLSHAMLEKMAYWCRRMKYGFQFRHISDNSAFNQFQAAKGSTDASDIYEYTKEIIAGNPERYGNLEAVRMVECPKPPGSVPARVGLTVELLMDRQILISATCKGVKGMFFNLPRAKDQPDSPDPTSKWKHPFDAMTYPMYFRKYCMKRGFFETKPGAVEVVV